MFLLCAAHCASVLFQNETLKAVTADAHLYYYDLDMYTVQPLRLGTSIIVYVTQTMIYWMNFAFIELMLIYGMLGAGTILILTKWIDRNFDSRVKLIGITLCFVPGLHFWTSSIGKDAPISIGIILIIISAFDIRRKIWIFSAGMLLCLLIRPHILIILMASLVGAHILRNKSLVLRIGAVVVALAFIPLAQLVIQSFLGVDILNSNDFSSMLSDRENYVENTVDEGVIYIGNPFTRLIYFTFNPLFFNATSTAALIASVENLILIILYFRIMIGFRAVEESKKTLAIFLALFVFTMILFQGLGGYNIGLALRQKVMIYPALIMLFLICENGRAIRRLAQGREARVDSAIRAALLPG